ncbi:unnamed protein product [Schistosoma mattheei]|uniref:Uncharacterized protein n=1 Tax=Schistosoma mattheei TaxID=31246 RepID=A0AA85AWM5_9TREM|nr:unnamed protein product [Schistosoma mattheei]
MCSQEEDEDCSCVFNSIIKKNERLSYCIKCQSQSSVLIRKDDPSLCKSCFIHHCLHKINMIFGKYKLTTTQMNNSSNNNNNNMAIAYSGGQNSSTLLNLIIQIM